MSTTLQKTNIKDKFLSNFRKQKVIDEPFFQQIKKEAAQALQNMEFPTLKDEYWKYTNISPILKRSYRIQPSVIKNIDNYKIDGVEAYTLVFINGFFVSKLSDTIDGKQLIIEPLTTAINKNDNIVKSCYAKHVDYKTQTFVALNTAYNTDGAFIYIPDNLAIEKPIHIIHLTDGGNIISQPRNLFIIGKNCKVKVIHTYETIAGNDSLTNSVTEIVLKENARLEYDTVQNENANSSQIVTTQVYQHANSCFLSNTITLNGGLIRNNLNVIVDGEGCETNLYGLYILNKKQHVDNHTRIDHKKPHCQSNELYKGIINDRATGVFNGKVYVHQEAQKTNAFQSNQNILLTDDARVYSKPELEIYADDVKCSHGSTTGQLDDEAVFYLRSRGLSEQSAKKLLLGAFAGKVLSKIGIEPLRKEMEKRIIKPTN